MVEQKVSNLLWTLSDIFQGFRGQARVIIPTQTSCYECSLDMHGKRTVYPVCTIATTPRLPEHCIEWASVLEWPRVFPGMSTIPPLLI
jgi:NEDD8-activating enzyme E1